MPPPPNKKRQQPRAFQVGKSKPRSLENAFAGKIPVRPTNTSFDIILRELGLLRRPKKAPGATFLRGGLPGLGKRK